MPLGFTTFELRTKDVNGAKKFYSDLLGMEIECVRGIPPKAVAMGVPSHWLGFVSVPNLAESLNQFLQQGGRIVGPREHKSGERECAVLKDPGGSLIGLESNCQAGTRLPVGFCQLVTAGAPDAATNYSKILGWKLWSSAAPKGPIAAQLIGLIDESLPNGMIVDVKDIPGSHPHWLFYFEVPELTGSTKRILALGGDVVGTYVSPLGAPLAVCHDPQGAAFGIIQ